MSGPPPYNPAVWQAQQPQQYPPAQYGGAPPPPQQYGGAPPPPQQYGGPPPPQQYGGGPPPPQQYQHYPGPSSTAYGAQAGGPPQGTHHVRRAMLVGINYIGTRNELRGCINDAKCMRHLLKTRYGFADDQILLLTEDNPNQVMWPTRQNILNGLRWLVNVPPGATASLFLHMSGHGGQVRDRDGDEGDGMDETFLPLDHARHGPIVDDEINAIAVRPLRPGTTLHAVVDACHSGTVMDLPLLWNGVDHMGNSRWMDDAASRRARRGTSGGQAICISACDDRSYAADTRALSGKASTGALTFCFIEAIESGHARNYLELMERIRWRIKTAERGGGSDVMFPSASVGGVLGMLLGGGGGGPFTASTRGFPQIAQLSAGQPFDLRKDFIL